MPIMGINLDKCTNCRQCIKECPMRLFSLDETQKQTIFDGSKECILCGHCIAVCPENAIDFKDMRDDTSNFEENQDPSELISYNTMHQFLRAKRSVRQYQGKKVPTEIIEKVIDSMRYAPTGANMRMLKCLILSDDEQIKLLSDSIINEIEKGGVDNRLSKLRDEGIDPIFYRAPHVLILYSKNPWDSINTSIAMTYGMLSAQTMGLGTCWIGFAQGVLLENSRIREEFTGIKTYVLGVFTLGYPLVKYYRAPPRPPLEIRWKKI
jgi:nitroreductase/NAD-dependent dihydropyrimidine dehydrogenase PreA subunit